MTELFDGLRRSAPKDSRWKEGHSTRETLAAQRQLAWNLDGKYKRLEPIQSGISDGTSGLRRYDVEYQGGYSELKFGGNRVQKHQIREDVLIAQQGTLVRYDIVPHPVSARVTPSKDLAILRENRIPYRVWQSEFWNLPRGGGLGLQLTWPPNESEQVPAKAK